jgi:hypothetical protein
VTVEFPINYLISEKARPGRQAEHSIEKVSSDPPRLQGPLDHILGYYTVDEIDRN